MLNTEEEKIFSFMDQDVWKPAGNLEEWKTLLSQAATDTLAKDQRINIRISKNDLDNIKIKAVEE